MVLLDQTDLKSKERDKNLMEMEMEFAVSGMYIREGFL